MTSVETEACVYCGLVVAGGWPACQALFTEVNVLTHSDPRLGPLARVVTDTYSLQHEEQYCGRAIGLAAHLAGLCVAVEHKGHPNVYQALHRWLDRVARRTVQYPPAQGIPQARGPLTIGDVHRAMNEPPEAFQAAVRRWAESTWQAYVDLQPLARGWVEEALRLR